MVFNFDLIFKNARGPATEQECDFITDEVVKGM